MGGAEQFTAFIAEIDRIAARIREWNEYRLEQQIEKEKRTIDLRVDKASEIKAANLAAVQLQNSSQWVETQKQRLQIQERRAANLRKSLEWVGARTMRVANTWIFFAMWSVIIAGWGWVGGWIGGINTPPIVVCQDSSDLCYRLKIWGVKSALNNLPTPDCKKTSQGMLCTIKIKRKPAP